MSDLISRQQAYEVLTDYYHHKTDVQHDALKEALSRVPSAEPEQHRGEWIEDVHKRGFSECSKCGYIAVGVLSRRHYNFCPNCGADMR